MISATPKSLLPDGDPRQAEVEQLKAKIEQLRALKAVVNDDLAKTIQRLLEVQREIEGDEAKPDGAVVE